MLVARWHMKRTCRRLSTAAGWLVLLVLAAASASAQPAAASSDVPSGWRWNGPFGGGVAALASSTAAPQTILARTFQALYRSTNGGRSWSRQRFDYLQGIAFSQTDPSRAYAASLLGIFRSDDAGATWEQVSDMDAVNGLVVDPRDRDRVYLTDGSAIARSDDGGRTWVSLDAGLPLDDEYELVADSLTIDPVATRRVYVVGADGVYRSGDRGAHWRRVFHQPSVDRIALDQSRSSQLIAMGGDPHTVVWRSGDRGAHWHRIGGISLFGPSKVNALVFSGTGDETVYAGMENYGIFVSHDDGRHWRKVVGGYPADWEGFFRISLLPDPQTSGRLLAASWGSGVKRSADGGQTWALSNRGLDAVDATALAVDPSTRGVAYVGAEDGLFRTADNGHSWRLMSNPTSSDLRGPVAVGADGAVYGIVRNTTGRSLDGGRRWQRVGVGLSRITTITADPARANVLYATGGDPAALYRSSDHGGHFHVVLGGAQPDEFASIAVDPSHSCTVYYSTGYQSTTIYRTRNCGQSWTPAYDNPSSYQWIVSLAVDQAHPHIVYAGLSPSGLLRSTDRGRHWKAMPGPGEPSSWDLVAMQSAPSGRLYAAVGNTADFIFEPPAPDQAVYVSVDRGLSWRSLPRLPAVVRTLAIGTGGGGETVFAGTWGHGVLVTSPP
jgi:photosystem II stability/assembly factor-like uncharacterized protein